MSSLSVHTFMIFEVEYIANTSARLLVLLKAAERAGTVSSRPG